MWIISNLTPERTLNMSGLIEALYVYDEQK